MANLFTGGDGVSLIPIHLKRQAEQVEAAAEQARKLDQKIDADRIRRLVQSTANARHDRFMIEPNRKNKDRLTKSLDVHQWLAAQPDSVVVTLGLEGMTGPDVVAEVDRLLNA